MMQRAIVDDINVFAGIEPHNGQVAIGVCGVWSIGCGV